MIMRKARRGFVWVVSLLMISVAAALWATDSIVASAGRNRCFAAAETIPFNKVGLVLGTSPWMRGGRANPHYVARIEAAALLYKARKVRYLLVSGDNGRRIYDEPSAMRRDLVAEGVPKASIVCDYAGFRTLDSIVRAKKVFGLSHCTIISQRFHNERALYIADSIGLNAVAFDAADPPGGIETRLWWRERFSRLTAVLDTQVFGTQPRFLGDPISVGEQAAALPAIK